MTERKRKMAELRGDGLGRLDQGLVGSVEARGAERLGKKARARRSRPTRGTRGHTGPRHARSVDWVDSIIWLIGWSR
jgi:hypothetical protein